MDPGGQQETAEDGKREKNITISQILSVICLVLILLGIFLRR